MNVIALFAILAMLGALPAAATTPDAVTVTMREWTVPWPDSRPRDPFVESPNRVWFVGQRDDYIGLLDPATGAFRRFDLDRGTGPHNLIVDGAGIVWYAGNRAAHIGRLDPQTGEITKIAMPDPAARDPHTLVFNRQGDIWFTLQGANMIGRLTVATGAVSLIRVPTPRARPYGIALDTRGRPWIAEVGTNKLGTADPATMTYREIELPRPGATPRRIAITSDGAVWYVDYAKGYLGRYRPDGGGFREWRSPAGANSRPYAMAVDDRDRVWYFETGPQPNRLIGFDAGSLAFISTTEVESGGGTVRNMVHDPGSGALWFGTDTNTIGRARIE